MAVFEAWRRANHAEAFFPRYFTDQVVASFVKGRQNVERDPRYYAPVIRDWYLSGAIALVLLVIALVARRRVHLFSTLPFQLGGLGLALWFSILLAFTVSTQKNTWYVHFGMAGAALVVGTVLSGVPKGALAALSAALGVGPLGWCVFCPKEVPLTAVQQHVWSIQRLTFPTDATNCEVQDCSGSDAEWATMHLMAFSCRATRVPCDTQPPWRFDGRVITPAVP